MAIIIDESKPNQISRTLLIEGTNCLGNRLLAIWLDYILIALICLFAGMFIETELWFLFPFCLILACLYFPLLEGIKGWTVGKFICCIRVVNEEGNKPGFPKAFIRTLLRFVEANPFLLGALPAVISLLLSKSHQRIGDRLAGTYVVKSKSFDDIKK